MTRTLPPERIHDIADDIADDTSDDTASTRTRICLSCQAPFESLWAGERICKPCKSRSAWRGGGSMRTHSRGA